MVFMGLLNRPHLGELGASLLHADCALRCSAKYMSKSYDYVVSNGKPVSTALYPLSPPVARTARKPLPYRQSLASGSPI